MKKLNLAVILFLVVFGAAAQSDYMVTLKSDTVKGELRILSYDQQDRIQVSMNGKKVLYKALEVLIVSIKNSFYKPVQMDNTIRFMKVIKSGYLSLYGFRMANQSTYDGRYLVKLNGDAREMPNIGFKKVMAAYLEDCSALSEKLQNGDIGKSSIEEIVDQYNTCLTKEKPAPVVTQALAPESPTQTKQLEAIQQLITKIKTLEFATRQDALDILSDIESKVTRNENVANYQLDGLRSTLKEQTTITQDLDALIELFKK